MYTTVLSLKRQQPHLRQVKGKGCSIIVVIVEMYEAKTHNLIQLGCETNRRQRNDTRQTSES